MKVKKNSGLLNFKVKILYRLLFLVICNLIKYDVFFYYLFCF